MRDVQVLIDENYFNYHLFTLFYTEEPVSLTEALINSVPDDYIAIGSVIRAMMNT